MKRLDITADGAEEAKIAALEQGITVILDATKAWKKQGKPMFEKQLKVFAASIMTKHRYWGFEGAGIIISLNEGKENVKKYPTKLVNYIRKGRCKLKRIIEIRSKLTNEVFGCAFTKTEAVALAKEIVATKKEDVYAKTRYESTDTDFECLYYPTKGSKSGSYVVFGVESNDAELYKKKLYSK